MLTVGVLSVLLLGSAVAEAGASRRSEWEAYKRRFNKVYSGRDEEESRRAAYEQNLAEYAKLNALEPLAQYGPTKFSDSLRKDSRGGFRSSGIQAPELEVDVSVEVPAARDWTGVYTSDIKDQSSCGGCWAESAIEQVESDAMREHNWTGVLSTQELIDCTSDGQGSWRGGCGGGDPTAGYDVLQKLGGVASGYEYKFEVRDARCMIDNYTKYVRVKSHFSVGKNDEVAMKRYVGSTGPLSVCVDASDWSGYEGGIKTTCGKSTDHCVQLVGYGSHKGVEYWKVRNSWGTSFGEDGYIRLQMGKNLCNIANGPTATSTHAVAYAPVPAPSPACRDHPIDWRSSEGDSCSLYDLNSYCTADGREGPGWETCANGNITKYADKHGVTPLQACCACGGGTAPKPPAPAPPPPPPATKCTDYPNWRSSEGDSCCVYPWNSYCTADGKEGPSWRKSWGPISKYADPESGLSALEACCGCGGGHRGPDLDIQGQ